MTAPLVSVIVPAYNAEAFIAQTIDSVRNQTVQDFELIIVDDVSTDGTNNIVSTYAANDNRIKHIKSDINRGPGVSRNTGIGNARGEWIAILDADDWYEPDRLEKLINAANLDGVAIAADNQRFVMAVDGSWQQLLVDRKDSPLWRLTADDLLRGDQLHRTARNLGLLKPVIRKKFLFDHNITYDAEITIGEDFYFLLKCLRYSPHLIFVFEPLYNYRIYLPTSQTKNQKMDGFFAMRTLHARYYSLFDPDDAPDTVKLMEQRRLEIERYIRFKQIVEPLKHGQLGSLLKQAIRDPGGILLLLKEAACDPIAVFLQFSNFIRFIFRRITDVFTVQKRLV